MHCMLLLWGKKFNLYLCNKILLFCHVSEQSQYKNNSNTWKRPPVEQVCLEMYIIFMNFSYPGNV